MRNRVTRFLAATAMLALVGSTAHAQGTRGKPKELKVLGQFVGDWTSEVTSKPAVWTPKEKKFRTSNHAEFVLDGWFLQHIEVNHVVGDPDKVTKSLFIWTFDPKIKKFVGWTFHSSGNITKAIGTWDATTKTLTHSYAEVPPNTTSQLTQTFPNNSTINGTLVYTGNDGTKLFDMVWTRTRRKGVAPDSLRKQWVKIGTPIKPLPKELKRHEPFIGEWDAEFVQRPSVVSPRGGTSKGSMTARWILDGRFLFGTTEVAKHHSMWVIGYDTNRKAYRYLRFTNTGLIDESTGQWDGDVRSFLWKIVNERPGITRTSTSRFVGKDGIHTHVLAENKEGKVQMDLTIRGTRRK